MSSLHEEHVVDLVADFVWGRLEGEELSRVRAHLEGCEDCARDFAAAEEGQLPMGEPEDQWSYGDIDAGFKDAKLVLDESFVTASIAHHSMEPRSCLSYWQNGKCYVYGSCQSQSFPVPFLAQYIGIKPEELVFIAEYCGGGFGSKGSAYPAMSIPAHMSKKTGRPVKVNASVG